MVKTLKRLNACLLMIIIILVIGTEVNTVQAANQTASYNYSFWGESVHAPAAYYPTRLVDGEGLGVGMLNSPTDFHVSEDNMIYMLDTGNDRIVVLDEEFQLVETIQSFDKEGELETFSNPRGLFVTMENDIFIADTDNRRVVHLDEDLNLVKIIDDPQSELINENFVFQPLNVVVDNANRVYVMADGVFDGFMEFNVDGYFTTFIGANRVQVDPIEYLWKRFATREQRSQMLMFVPTEFTSMDINEDGFIYATNGDGSDDAIKKLNSRGDDILRREGYFNPIGDVRYTTAVGPSRLIDIDVTDSEIYSVLDARRGRIFTYNGDGHLMYVFGGIGNQLGEFHTPVAIERLGDDFLVLDRELGEITVFETTEYGRTLNEAVRSYERGDEESAFELYQEAVHMNANLEFAYAGIGKALLRKEEFNDAMHNFEQSLDQANYSKAFLLYRNEILRDYFSIIMTGIMVLAVLLVFLRIYLKKIRRKRVASI
nr:NHL repeat-containing protein [Halalkalibacter hemicellulosilyticus]